MVNNQNLRKQLLQQIMQQKLKNKGAGAPDQSEEPAAFSDFSASQLYCPKCKRAMPVREKMLLVLTSGELYDYVCVQCGTSLGTRNT